MNMHRFKGFKRSAEYERIVLHREAAKYFKYSKAQNSLFLFHLFRKPEQKLTFKWLSSESRQEVKAAFFFYPWSHDPKDFGRCPQVSHRCRLEGRLACTCIVRPNSKHLEQIPDVLQESQTTKRRVRRRGPAILIEIFPKLAGGPRQRGLPSDGFNSHSPIYYGFQCLPVRIGSGRRSGQSKPCNKALHGFEADRSLLRPGRPLLALFPFLCDHQCHRLMDATQ